MGRILRHLTGEGPAEAPSSFPHNQTQGEAAEERSDDGEHPSS